MDLGPTILEVLMKLPTSKYAGLILLRPLKQTVDVSRLPGHPYMNEIEPLKTCKTL